MINVQLKKLSPDAILPEYKTPGAAGMDLCALLARPLWLQPGAQHMVPTGIALHLADPSYCGKIYPRSGLGAKHGIVLGNLVGLIDSDYQGELMVCLWNRSERAYEIQPGERIAQLCIEYVERANFVIVEAFDASERGTGGFGSTGK